MAMSFDSLASDRGFKFSDLAHGRADKSGGLPHDKQSGSTNYMNVFARLAIELLSPHNWST